MLIALPQRKLIIECNGVNFVRHGTHYVMRVETVDHSMITLDGLWTEEEADAVFWGTFESLKENDGRIAIDTNRLRAALEHMEEQDVDDAS
jgi:hypothetical protein